MKKSARHAEDRLISGKKRRRPVRTGETTRVAAVDGVDYTWARRHAFGVWGRRVQVVSVSVWLDPGRTRELVLDLALPTSHEEPTPGAERVAAAVGSGIRAARAAGWDPESRGRAFRFEWSGE